MILLQNGNREKKGEFNIIAIFNTENEIVNREKLPTLLVNSSLYFIIKKMTNDEISNIIEKKFQKAPFYYDNKLFYKSFITTINTSKEFSNENILTLNDISKYIMFRNITNGCVDESIISQMIFAYRFIQKDDIEKILNKLNLLSMKFSPIFKYSYPPKELLVFINNKIKNPIKIKTRNSEKIDVEKIEKKILTLTTIQRQSLLFMIISILSKRTCIIQGETASGKSKLIPLIAEMLGKNLLIYQINSYSDISILTGQNQINEELSEEEKTKLTNNLEQLKQFIKIENIENIKPRDIKKIIDEINLYINDNKKKLRI